MNACRTALRLVVGTALLIGTSLLLMPQQASACSVSIGYKPSVSISDLAHPRGCSTGTSLAGAAAVAALALGALGAVGWRAFRHGEKTAGLPSPTATGPSSSLTAYLNAAGITPSTNGQNDAS